MKPLLILALLAAPASAQTAWTNPAGAHTVSTCTSGTETWEELGETCHADKMFRRDPDGRSNITSMTTSMIAAFHFHSYTFEPKDDISAPELSKALVAILPALVCHNSLGNGCDPTEKIEALPPEAKRHFVLHDSQ